jgi:hypothetical protein
MKIIPARARTFLSPVMLKPFRFADRMKKGPLLNAAAQQVSDYAKSRSGCQLSSIAFLIGA